MNKSLKISSLFLLMSLSLAQLGAKPKRVPAYAKKNVPISFAQLKAKHPKKSAPTVEVKTEKQPEVAPVKYKFAPALEWMETLGFITKEDVIKIVKELVLKQQQFFMKEIRTLTAKVGSSVGNSLGLSKEDQTKLAFLLKQVVSYR